MSIVGRCRGETALATIVLVAAIAARADAQAVSACDAKHVIGGSAYISRICDVPDFDQRRNAATLAGDGRSRLVRGLAGNGGCHCVPTTIVDLLGFYAQKGVDVHPGAYPWLLRSGYQPGIDVPPHTYFAQRSYPDAEIDAYNRVGRLQAMLGATVKTGDAGCGTSYGKVLMVLGVLTLAGEFPHARFDVLSNGVNAQTPFELAYVQSMGGTVGVSYGRYTNYMESGVDATATARNGGHAMALEGVAGETDEAVLKVRDPAGDEGNDRYRNSTFALTSAPIVRRSLTVDGKTRWRWRWGALSSSGTQRVLDGWIALMPTLLVTTDGKDLGVHAGVDLNNQDRPAMLKTKFTFKREVRAAAVLPATGEIAVVLEGSSAVHGVRVHDRRLRRIGRAPGRITDLVADPAGRRIFALSGRRLVRMDRRGRVLARLTLPRPAERLAYDPSPESLSAQRVVAVGRAGRRATTISPGRLEVVDVQRLPRSAVRGPGRLDVAFDDRGRLVLRRGASGALRVTSSRRSAPVRTTSLHGVRGRATGFALTHGGSIIAVRGGRTVELAPGGTRVMRGSPFNGVRVRGRILAITRSGGDLMGMSPDTVIDERIPYDPAFPEMAREVPAPKPPPPPQDPPPPPPPPPPNLIVDEAGDDGATIRNAGGTAAGRFEVHVTRAGDTPEVVPVEGLAAGASTRIALSCRRTEERTLTVDATGAVTESDEGDNTRVFTQRCR